MRDASCHAGGYIRLYRSLLSWEWFQDSATLHVFLFLLLSACFAPVRHEGVSLAPGQLITSFRTICRHTGLSDSQVRTAIRHLKSTHEITQQSSTRFTVITITNFQRYQSLLPHAPSPSARTPSAQQPHKNKNVNHVNHEKKKGDFPHEQQNGNDPCDRNDLLLSALGLCL